MEVLEAERQHHLQASVYSSDDVARERANGIVMWLDGVLMNNLKDQYEGQAQLAIDEIKAANGKGPATEDTEGSAWMAPDGLDT